MTTGAIRRAKLQSNRHHQQTKTKTFSTGRMPFLSSNQQCQSTDITLQYKTMATANVPPTIDGSVGKFTSVLDHTVTELSFWLRIESMMIGLTSQSRHRLHGTHLSPTCCPQSLTALIHCGPIKTAQFKKNNNNTFQCSRRLGHLCPHNPRGRRLAVPAFLDFSLVFNPRDLYYRE